jgi:nucleoside 2-deoxyribosyltransferase
MKNIIQIDLGDINNTCFVVMPFSPVYQSEYENIIKPAITELNIKCERGDEIYAKQRIMDDIWSSIRNCRFVLAELTGRNPNVLYEIGLAHAIGKPVIIITRNGDDVPFDLKDLRYLYYDVNEPFWGENLKKGIQSLVQKLIENPELENYLEGITKPIPIKYPEISKEIVKEKPVKKIIDISGNWIGSFDLNGYHGVTLNITQDGTNLSANAVVTIERGINKNVVQEIMAGTIISEKKATLIGVNYSFVKRGRVNDYHLDFFEFNEFKDNLIVGFVYDEQNRGFKGEIRLTRNVT